MSYSTLENKNPEYATTHPGNLFFNSYFKKSSHNNISTYLSFFYPHQDKSWLPFVTVLHKE